MKRSTLSLLPALAWLIITTFLLTLPGKAFPKENWLDKLWVDKWVHIFLFGVLVWLWCRAMPKIGVQASGLGKVFLTWAILWFAYGIGMEFVQKYLIPNRGFDVWDIVADGLGALLGLLYSRRQYIKK